jgi:hypothetical protein
MIRPSIIAVIVALGSLHATAAAAQDHSLRWARGVVTTSAPGSLTLMLRDRSLTIEMKGDAPAAGAVVEVHYSEKKDVRTAVWVFKDASAGSAEWSKKPGHSYWGVTQSTGRGSFQLMLGKKARKLDLDSHTRLLDSDGQVLAKGKKDVAPLLATGQRVVVKYEENDDTVYGGDTVLPGSSTKAIEVRKLK